MYPENYRRITAWTEDDLLDLPDSETDLYEYKSSLIRESPNYRGDLSSKLTKTASALWNTGGGILVVGVDDHGAVDGGVPAMMGRQKLRDWVDIILNTVSPVGPYTVQTIASEHAQSRIEAEMVVLVVAFGESFDLPHMAPDSRYYVRSGAHSNPANHYIVEALRARRGLERPSLRALLRKNPQKSGIIELTIVTINDLPALNVQIQFDPLPTHLADKLPDQRSLTIPLIDRNNPFRMDIATTQRLSYWLGNDPFTVLLQYEGLRGTVYQSQQTIDYIRSLGPGDIPLSNGGSPERILKKINKQLSRLNRSIERITQATLSIPSDDDS